jgi:hypothetical protein
LEVFEPLINFNVSRFCQISESHCGPAVIQMLLANLEIEVTQEAIAEAAGATELIELNGTRVDQLAKAVSVLAPQAQFWYKDKASLEELISIVNDHHYPVGVEWQGLFEGDDEEDEEEEDDTETGDDDYGHYSIVTLADVEKQQLIIADPYKDFISQARIFGFKEFDERWYDYNEVTNPRTGRPKIVKDDHMMFIVTSRRETFPEEMGMKRGA